MADLQAQIPQHVENEFDDAFFPWRLLERPEKQKIDIRSRRQKPASITTRRDHSEPFGRCRVLRVIEMFDGKVVDDLDDGVLQFGERARRSDACQSTCLGMSLDERAMFVELGFDEIKRALAQLCLIARVMRERRQRVAQRFAVQRFNPSRSFKSQWSSCLAFEGIE